MKKLRTIAIFSGYSFPHTGGIESYTKRIIQELNSRGIKVINVSSNYANEPDYWEVSEFLEEYRLPIFSLGKNRFPIPKRNKTYQKLIQKLIDSEIAAIIVNTRFHLTSLIGGKLGKEKNIPVYLVEHGSAPLTLGNIILDIPLQFIEDRITDMVKGYVTHYKATSVAARDHIRKKYGFISDGFWFNQVETGEICQTHQYNTNKIKIKYVGRVLRQKGVEVLLKAASILNEKNVPFELEIIGDGPELNGLQDRYETHNILFSGREDHEMIMEKYLSTDVVVVVVNYPESLNGVVLEAGASGCCVIATKVPGISEIIIDKVNGIYVQKNDVDELAKQLEYFVNQKQKIQEYGQALKKSVTQCFSVVKIVSRMIEEIEKDLN